MNNNYIKKNGKKINIIDMVDQTAGIYDADMVIRSIKSLSMIIDAKNNGSYSAAEIYEDIINLLKNLKYKQRLVIYYRYVAGYSEYKTADVTNYSISYVEKLTHDALAAIRIMLGGGTNDT